MLQNAFVDFALRHFPKQRWNQLSSICASMSIPHIGSPVTFTHRKFTLREYPFTEMPPDIEEKFIRFCYPSDLPDREKQIEREKKLYWKNASSFIVEDNSNRIAGCVQIIHRTRSNILPAEYGFTREGCNGSLCRLTFSNVYNPESLTEIYHCRRSFTLNRIESVNVILMLFKAIVAHSIETETVFSFLTYDRSKPDLRHLYTDKCDFTDTATDLYFTEDQRPWRLLKKDWYHHECTYATKGRTQFFMQTWFRAGLKKKHLRHPSEISSYLHDSNLIDSGNFTLAHTVTPADRKLYRSIYKSFGLQHKKSGIFKRNPKTAYTP